MKRYFYTKAHHALTSTEPSALDTLVDPSRTGDADDLSRTLGAQSGMLARYLIEREGAMVIGKLGRAYVARKPLAETFAGMRSLPRDMAELERRWLVWLDTRED